MILEVTLQQGSQGRRPGGSDIEMRSECHVGPSSVTQLGEEHSRHLEQQVQSPGVRSHLVCWRDRKEAIGLEKSELGRESGDEEVRKVMGPDEAGPCGPWEDFGFCSGREPRGVLSRRARSDLGSTWV